MKYVFVFLILMLSGCNEPEPVTFAERAARAEALENTPSGALFLTAVLKEIGESINQAAGECYAHSPLKKDSFTLVANISRDGRFEKIAVQPETETTRCYAKKIAELRTTASRPAGYSDRPFPVVLNVHYNK